MGFSDRTGVLRRLADRVEDLIRLTDVLGLQSPGAPPVVTVAHDWGGPISLGWALAHHRRTPGSLAGVVLTNTAVHQPAGSPAPSLIRATRQRGLLPAITVGTSAFIRGAFEMSRPRLDAAVRHGFLAPYESADRRRAIADFVADIPLDPSHPSAAALDGIADGLEELADTPALLLWGPADKVFSDLYLHDLERRLPHADVHRFVGAAHFVQEEADVAGAITTWLATITGPEATGAVTPVPQPPIKRPPLWAALQERSDDQAAAVVEVVGGVARSISFAQLHDRVEAVAAGFLADGIRPGERVALMVPPGIDLTIVLYACWRMGAVMVLVDSGLGPRNMGRALASADPDHLIGIDRALVAARALRWPGRRISVSSVSAARRRALGVDTTIDAIEAAGRRMQRDGRPAKAPGDGAEAAVVFTSGSTGPSKGVVYRHRQLQAVRDQLAALYRINRDDRLVAAFAPFALFGPALGIPSVVPEMDVAQPGTLSATALGEAAAAIEPTLVFASPAALVNVVSTSSMLSPSHRRALDGVRLLLSAGAPVNPSLLEQVVALMPNAEPHTPYGMTEALPVADISLNELRERSHLRPEAGVCVGRPRPDVTIAISALDAVGTAIGPPTFTAGVIGEVLVAADHVMDHYDRLWYSNARAGTPSGWHRSGDVGQLDGAGYLWIGGRLEHAISTAAGIVMPVAIEVAVDTIPGVNRSAAVGIGPAGSQAIAVVIEPTERPARAALAAGPIMNLVRDAVDAGVGSEVDVAAVLIARQLPVDRRHNSKIDRARLAAWANDILAGGRVTSP